MERELPAHEPMRPVMVWTLAVCLAVAAAPWLSGGQEPLAQLVSGFSLFLGCLLAMREPSVRNLRFGPLVAGYVGLLGFGALSLLWTANRFSTLGWLINLLLVGAAFRLAVIVAGEVRGRRRLVVLYLVSAGIFVAYAWWAYLTGSYDRLIGSFYWPNPAAAYLTPAVLVCFDWWRRGGQWWLGLLTAVFGASFVLTDSRAMGVVALIIVLIYCLCIKLNKRFWIILVFSIGATAAAVFGLVTVRHIIQPAAAISVPGSRLSPATATNVQSGADRVRYLSSVWHIWLDHPLGGSGAGTYADVHPAYQERVISAASSAHNVYAQTLAELGLIGGLLLLWIMVCLAVGAVRGLVHYPLGLAVSAGVAAIWLHFGLDIDAQYPALVLLAAIITGSMYYQRPGYTKLSWRWPIALALVVVPITALYLGDAQAVRGRAAQADGDYELAADYFARSHGYVFYNPDVLTAEGINIYTLGLSGKTSQLITALDLAHRAEHQDPRDAQHYQLAGLVQTALKQPAQAEAAFRRALVLDPYNHPEYAYGLALIQLQSGRAAAGIDTANIMLRQYPPEVVANRSADPTIRRNLARLAVLVGSIKLQAGDRAGAQAASRQALGYDPSDARAQAFAHLLGSIAP